MVIKFVEFSSVSPSDDAVAEQSLPLQYFDMIWLRSRLTESLYFYALKCPESDFLNTTLPQLKHSLSITLKHFLPLAGKIIFPLTSATMPLFQYTVGDSVALTVAVSDADFAGMTGHHPRTADEFHHLVPQMPSAEYSADGIRFSPLAVQVTFFPNHGVCIGFTHHHTVCDGRGFVDFVRTWASVNKLNSDANLVGHALPFYDRSRVEDAAKLDRLLWSEAKVSRPTISLTDCLPTHRIRASFVVNDAHIERLKNFVAAKKPAMGRVSTFVAVCAHLWISLVKSGEAAFDEEPEYFAFPVDCRARLQPPLPENFFGNCLFLMRASSTHGKLRGSEGFVEAAEVIAAAIDENVKLWRGTSDYFETRRSRLLSELIGKKSVVWLVGSSRFEQYEADYGWGRPIKYECIHTGDGLVNMYKGRDGGIEIGLSMPKANIDAFAQVFNKELCINSKL